MIRDPIASPPLATVRSSSPAKIASRPNTGPVTSESECGNKTRGFEGARLNEDL
jgi:hypothetical protein